MASQGTFRSRVTAVEAAVGVSLIGTLLAVAVPAFSRNLETSDSAEVTGGLARIHQGVRRHALGRAGVPPLLPPSVALTPAIPPRGTRAVDPPGTWDHPTWVALGFRPAPEGVPHAYAFEFQSTGADSAASFVGIGRGDLDGDGVLSTFELRGSATEDAAPAIIHVESERE
jgi:hypothetical protein